MLVRLPLSSGRNRSKDDHLRQLHVMLQNGDFVSYYQLDSIVEELPVSQGKLQTLQVLSRCLLQWVCAVRVWRLNESLPYNLKIKADSLSKVPVCKKNTSEDVDQRMEEEHQLDDTWYLKQ